MNPPTEKITLTDEQWLILFPDTEPTWLDWFWYIAESLIYSALAIFSYPLTLAVIFAFPLGESQIPGEAQYVARASAAIMAVTFLAALNFVLREWTNDFND